MGLFYSGRDPDFDRKFDTCPAFMQVLDCQVDVANSSCSRRNQRSSESKMRASAKVRSGEYSHDPRCL